MSINNAGKIIKEARLRAGLTQEELSEGICSALSLSHIENNHTGISPVTFQALMAHAGASHELFPIFANRRDFDCYYSCYRIEFYINSWQLKLAHEELDKLQKWGFANNILYYQKWLYLNGLLQIRSGNLNHALVLELLEKALKLTRPHIDYRDFRMVFLSSTELEILICVARELLFVGEDELTFLICSQMNSYLVNSEIDDFTKKTLLAKNALVYSMYLLHIKDYKEALAVADSYRHKMANNSCDDPLLELSFVTCLACYYCGDETRAYRLFNNVFFTAYSIDSHFATMCRNYVTKHKLFNLDDYIMEYADIPKEYYEIKKDIDTSTLTDGSYDFFSPDILTIGSLIKELRKEQKISQTILCQGLCSKSKLSKIENNTLQPDVFLVEALLQRLGLSERVFTFYGNAMQSRLHNLKFKLVRSRLMPKEEYRELLDQFEALLPKDDLYLKQLYVLLSDKFVDSPQEIISALENALLYTLPKFDIHYIHNYKLTWQELSILNVIAFQYKNIDINKSNYYFSKILEYRELNPVDILFETNIYTITLSKFTDSLYDQNRFYDIVCLHTDSNSNLLNGKVASLGFFLFYYCQCLGECKHFDQIKPYGYFACNIQELYEIPSNSTSLRKFLLEDFSVEIL